MRRSPRARGEFHKYQTPWCVCPGSVSYALCTCRVCERARVTPPCTYRAARHIGTCVLSGRPVCVHGPDLLRDSATDEESDNSDTEIANTEIDIDEESDNSDT